MAILGDHQASEDVTKKVVWYDGTNYEKGGTENTTFLQKGTTKVIGEFSDLTIEISGITVEEQFINFTFWLYILLALSIYVFK